MIFKYQVDDKSGFEPNFLQFFNGTSIVRLKCGNFKSTDNLLDGKSCRIFALHLNIKEFIWFYKKYPTATRNIWVKPHATNTLVY